MNDPISPQQIQQFAAAWYRALDVHTPLDECLSMLTQNDLSMRFPDGDINDRLSFQKWYEPVHHYRNIRLFLASAINGFWSLGTTARSTA